MFNVKPGYTLSFGVNKVASGVQFSLYFPEGKNCMLKLYKIGKKEPSYVVNLTNEYKRGGVYFVTITGKDDKSDIAAILSKDYEYMYEADGEEFIDPYAQVIHGHDIWGKTLNDEQKKFVRGGICLDEFDWEEDTQLHRAFEDSILYQLHVRGFTKHFSSKVKNKGTYQGIIEKIPYLKELGVNTLLVMPCYEFDEIMEKTDDGNVRLNYWGYGAAGTYYLAPKASYASDRKNPVNEFKTLVKSLHSAGIEILLDIYFTPGTNLCLMTDCLRHWVLNYHVDGFRVNQEIMPSIALVSDPILSGVKILGSYWDDRLIEASGVKSAEKLFAEFNEGFMNVARRFLKSDEGSVENFVNCFKYNSSIHSVVNFITYVNGFTLMDLVSYDIKHNEDNGEKNRDGTEINYSWNCGVEGKTRKKAVMELRMKQIRNAFIMLLCSQGTPMILAGDEFGNTQNGNNNPYCQDSQVTWLDWRKNTVSNEIFEYVKKLIAFRKEHRILRQKNVLSLIDTKGYGFPALSIHGLQAWRADYSNYSRELGLLLCGDYADDEEGNHDDTIYIIYNMYWEQKTFDLPRLHDGKKWYVAVTTYDNTFYDIPPRVNKPKKTKKVKKSELDAQRKTVVPPRSIVIFVGR